MIRLLIVDDEYYIRLGIKNAIDWKSIGIEIVGEAEDGEQGLAMALEGTRPAPYRYPYAIFGWSGATGRNRSPSFGLRCHCT